MSLQNNEEYEDNIIMLEDENGEEIEFEHIATVEVEGNAYVALVDKQDQLVILRIVEDESGEETLLEPESDEEYEKVLAKLDEFIGDEFEIVQ